MTSTTTSRIVWPRSALAGCIFCAIVRDTRGVALSQAERFNFFPASPLSCVTWVFSGGWYLIEGPDQFKQPLTGRNLPDIAFSGGQLGPIVSWNPGETYAVTLAFYPDAFSQMTGLDLSLYTGRMVPAVDVLPQRILEPCREFFDGGRHNDFEDSYSDLEGEIENIWSGVRPNGAKPVRWLEDWTRSLVVRAALSAPGRSSRQIARRVKSWTGVSKRDLKGLGHTEQLYAKIHEALQEGDVDWANLAAASGFSDQAHMIRRMRQHTGFTPEQLRHGAENDEALWAYRLLGQYFSKPEK